LNYVYVLRSLKNKKRYIGCTGLRPQERLKQQNCGSNKWSKHNMPLELVYSEEFRDKKEARKREIFLKTGAGKQFLDKAIK
jgi:putative endonuclease